LRLSNSVVHLQHMKQVIDTTALYSALLDKKEEEGLSWRTVAGQLGIHSSTFTRLYKGSRPDMDTVLLLTGWLGVPVERFLSGQAAARDERRETMVAIGTHLRADRRLTPESADAIAAVVKAAYDQLSEPTPSESQKRTE
jgi:transcriptional regulator with XRE-family HTH domain